MKKFVILICCLLMGLAMTGCGNKTTMEKKVLRVATTFNLIVASTQAMTLI